jgi:hypothetical protein
MTRILTAGLTVALLGGVVLAAGALVNYERKTNASTQQAVDLAADGSTSASPMPSTSATRGATAAAAPQQPVNNPVYQYAAPPPTAAPATTPSAAKKQADSGAAAKSTAAAKATSAPPPSYTIIGYGSSKCVDVTDHVNSAPSGTYLQIYDCGNNPNQQWTLYSDQTVRSLGLCMSVGGGATADGSVVDVATCDGSASQKWKLTSAADIVNIKANECLDVKDQSTADRAQLQLWSCSGNSNQKWRLG